MDDYRYDYKFEYRISVPDAREPSVERRTRKVCYMSIL